MSLKEESEKLPLAEKDGRGVGQGLRNAGKNPGMQGFACWWGGGKQELSSGGYVC